MSVTARARRFSAHSRSGRIPSALPAAFLFLAAVSPIFRTWQVAMLLYRAARKQGGGRRRSHVRLRCAQCTEIAPRFRGVVCILTRAPCSAAEEDAACWVCGLGCLVGREVPRCARDVYARDGPLTRRPFGAGCVGPAAVAPARDAHARGDRGRGIRRRRRETRLGYCAAGAISARPGRRELGTRLCVFLARSSGRSLRRTRSSAT